ncbi:MAG TPA: nuclear transport factor 2 family protein [Mycobacterium sp.]|nr:nuclear transport factor 2 family protein [Mycobacterium sp.]
MSREIEVVRRLFAAVEQRDLEHVLACYSDDIEITKAAVLPWGGVWRGLEGVLAHAERFMRAWGVLQGPEEARLDGHFWDDGAGTVCAVFRHRAVDPATGARFDAPEVGIYKVHDDHVVCSQMFHADSAAVVAFLSNVADGNQGRFNEDHEVFGDADLTPR